MVRICDAVAALHEKGIVHRDLKPSNILVTSEGMPKDLDFGIAQALAGCAATHQTNALWRTATDGSTCETLRYMSPEQLAGSKVDVRSDVYTLGVLLYDSSRVALRSARMRATTPHSRSGGPGRALDWHRQSEPGRRGSDVISAQSYARPWRQPRALATQVLKYSLSI